MKIISFDSFIFNFDFIAKPTRRPPPVDGEVEVYVSTFRHPGRPIWMPTLIAAISPTRARRGFSGYLSLVRRKTDLSLNFQQDGEAVEILYESYNFSKINGL